MFIMTSLALSGLGVALWNEFQKKKKKKKILTKKSSLSKSLLSTKSTITEDIKEQNYYQKTSLIGLGLTVGATLFYPPMILLAAPIMGYVYYTLLKESYRTIKEKKIALALFEFISITGLFVLGYYIIATFGFYFYFTTRKFILKTQRDTHIDFTKVFGSLPKKVWILKGEVELEVSLENIQLKDIVIVYSGEIIPIDGIIIKGEGIVDQQILTGEARAIEKGINDEVFASTILLSGAIYVQVMKKGEDSVTGQIAKILDKSAQYKTAVQSKGEKIVDKGAGITLLGSLISYPILGLSKALAFTYSGFGYQMRLSAPLMVLNYIKLSSEKGILIKDGRALEQLLRVDVVVFDKTGTLTNTIPEITQIISCSQYRSEELLQFAASAEKRQNHPIAHAILEKAKEEKIVLLDIKENNYEIGYGISVIFKVNQDKKILLGSKKFMEHSKIDIPIHLQDLQEQSIKQGNSFVYISNEDELLGIIELSPQIRAEAFEMVKKLYEMDKEIYIISGDQNEPTKHLAQKLGIKKHYAQTLPKDKAKIVEELQKNGKKVCFIGDGINDTVVLQKADVSISLHGAATIAMDVADILLIKPNLLVIPYLFTMSQELHQKLDNTMYLNNITSSMLVSSILFLGVGYGGAVFFYYASTAGSIIYAMLPLWNNKIKGESSDKN